ncbi:hypothetical protein KC960_02880 [Candidatus Saccharibacteria bacterium]|nr:hypothetical protein [Candidatus Saccharibacteria bacterium]
MICELLPDVLPCDIQEQALAEFDSYLEIYQRNTSDKLPEGITLARQWFAETIRPHVSGLELEKVGLLPEFHNHERFNHNSDIHKDNPGIVAVKYIMTICNVPNAGTIMFPGEPANVLAEEHYYSQDFFERAGSNGALYVRNSLPSDFGAWLLGKNGQIARFDYNCIVHAAAPLPRGAKKLLFWYTAASR